MEKENEIKHLTDLYDHALKDYDEQLRINEENKKINGELITENTHLQKQLEYLRSGEYYNQLRFERDMLQDLIDKGKVSKEDKEFIDCTHRNTELLEMIDKLKSELEKDRMEQFDDYVIYLLSKYLEILKGDSNE